MRLIASETIVIKPEQIRLVRRDDSKKWQVHYKLEAVKRWFRQSVSVFKWFETDGLISQRRDWLIGFKV